MTTMVVLGMCLFAATTLVLAACTGGFRLMYRRDDRGRED